MSENADEVPNERSTEGTNGNSVRMGTREAKTATFVYNNVKMCTNPFFEHVVLNSQLVAVQKVMSIFIG